MRRIIIIALSLLPFCVAAQESQLDEFFNRYSGQEGFTSVHITKYMFEIFKNVEMEDKAFQETVNNLNSIKILTADSTYINNEQLDFGKALKEKLPSAIYKEMMVIRDGGETISFMVNEEKGLITEFVMTVDGDSPVLIFMEGSIDLKQLSKLSKSMNVTGFEHLDKVDEK